MRRRTGRSLAALACAAALLVLLTSCAPMLMSAVLQEASNISNVDTLQGTAPEEFSEEPPEEGTASEDQETVYEAEFGSYTVPAGWVKSAVYSTDSKSFFFQAGHEDDTQPDNISVEVGSNRYSADEHMQFRDAILRQLAWQTQDLEGVAIQGDGTYTEQDYVLYIFTIAQEGVTTKQFYIVGDCQYCLVHLTNFTGDPEPDEAARQIADSFLWAE